MMVFDKTIEEIVDENYVYARALHYLGINFFETPQKRLVEVCRERGLDRRFVIKSFYMFDSNARLSFKELESYPIELMIEFLKHSHHIFIKEKLPFIVHLAKNWKANRHLSGLLPDFIEDLIKHIYEEEDSTFKYIQLLFDISKGKKNAPVSELIPFKNFSLEHEFEHHEEEDEFAVIRTLISSIKPENLHERVLISEIKAFDREMRYHAEIENKIFFPKAIELEKEVNKKIQLLSTLN
jgi:regulator of cell morphogenesis and NO signaling